MSVIRFDRLFEFDCRLPFVIDAQPYPAKSCGGVEKPAARGVFPDNSTAATASAKLFSHSPIPDPHSLLPASCSAPCRNVGIPELDVIRVDAPRIAGAIRQGSFIAWHRPAEGPAGNGPAVQIRGYPREGFHRPRSSRQYQNRSRRAQDRSPGPQARAPPLLQQYARDGVGRPSWEVLPFQRPLGVQVVGMQVVNNESRFDLQ